MRTLNIIKCDNDCHTVQLIKNSAIKLVMLIVSTIEHTHIEKYM